MQAWDTLVPCHRVEIIARYFILPTQFASTRGCCWSINSWYGGTRFVETTRQTDLERCTTDRLAKIDGTIDMYFIRRNTFLFKATSTLFCSGCGGPDSGHKNTVKLLPNKFVRLNFSANRVCGLDY